VTVQKKILLVFAVLLTVFFMAGPASAAFVTVRDNAVDDEPGQKDLTKMGMDEASLPTTLGVLWNWDDTAWSGSNTGDACSLYDTNKDGNAEYSLCGVVWHALQYKATRLYRCTNGAPDRCTGPTLIWDTENGPNPPAGSSTCNGVVVAGSDPYPRASGTCKDKNACLTDDTVATCQVQMSDFGSPGSAFLINVCSYPSQQPNSDPSDCVVIPGSGFLKLVKVANPNDGTKFTFTTDKPSTDGLTTFDILGSGTLLIPFAPNTIDLTEALPSGWSLDSATCTLAAGGSTGTLSGTKISGLQIQSGRPTTCTYTDSQRPATLILIKHLPNDNGGTATQDQFNVYIDNVKKAWGSNSVNVGPHTVKEDPLTGYTPSSWSNGCAADGAVTLAPGETKTCEITNNDNAPALHLRKTVDNGNGGTALATAWTLHAAGPTPLDGTTPVDSDNTFKKGTYSLSETGGPTGYTGTWSCIKNGGAPVAGSSIILDLGDTATCTVNNDDIAPQLTLRKKVTNDNGGTSLASAWTLSALDAQSHGPIGTGTQNPDTTKNDATLGPNAVTAGVQYSLDESGPTGYTKGTWSCVKNQEQPVVGNSITLAVGDTATCEISNDDKPATLHVIKHVVGGKALPGDFIITVTGNNPNPANFPGVDDPGTTVTLDAGDYGVSEQELALYPNPTYGENCVGNIRNGEVKTCTITNTYGISPTNPLVTKDAVTSFSRTYTWETPKEGWDYTNPSNPVKLTSLTLNSGQSFPVTYIITPHVTLTTDSHWVVSGHVTVKNPSNTVSMIIDSLSDALVTSDQPPLETIEPLDCKGQSLTLAPKGQTGDSITCDYSYSFSSAPPVPLTNRAIVTVGRDTEGAEAPVIFDGLSPNTMTEVDSCINIYDDKYTGSNPAEPFQECVVHVLSPTSYVRSIVGREQCGKYDETNTASFTDHAGVTHNFPWTIHIDVPCGGCTLTQGYWKTHGYAENPKKPNKIDTTWLAVGPKGDLEPFYLNTPNQDKSLTWYKAISTPPSGGNAYYILAKQYIGAYLNQHQKVPAFSPLAITDIMSKADTFFKTYTPTSKLSSADRDQAISWAGTLDKYNNGGTTGWPAHCPE